MAKQVIKLGLEFDTKGAIASYRQLVSEMQKGGADPKAIKQFTAAIEKAETELAQLAAEGSTGFSDSKSIEQFQKRVLKTTTSMQQLALRMQDFAKSGSNFPTSPIKTLETEIKKLKREIEELTNAAQTNLQKSLESLGFDKSKAEAIAKAVKSQEELNVKLEEERRNRQLISQQAADAAKTAASEARNAKANIKGNSAEVGAVAAGLSDLPIKKSEIDKVRELIAREINKGIRAGSVDLESMKFNLRNAIESTFSEDETLADSIATTVEHGVDEASSVIKDKISSIATAARDNKYQKAADAAAKMYGDLDPSKTATISQDYANALTQIATKTGEVTTRTSEMSDATKRSTTAQQNFASSAGITANNMSKVTDSFMNTSNAEKQTLKSTELLEGGFNRLIDRFKYMFGFTAMFNRLRQIIRSTFNDIQQLDKAYASIAYVTNETVASLWSTYNDYAAMAEKLGQSTADVIKASAIYRQQGLDTAESLELTTDTMKLATIAGNDYSTATQEMTAALRGFKMEMDEGSHVSDVYSELAAHAAASVDDIAQAMSRTASIANSAGMSFENTSAFLTQMIETTQESAENIGTSMKTIIARFTELKENVAGTEDSEFEDLSFNKVDEALQSVGVALKDTHGQFRNLDEVFLELSEKWSKLDRNTQRYIATVAAGSRQQSRFIAMMDNYDRTIELINTVADSEGKADEQFSKAADTVEFKLNSIKTKWEEFKLSIMSSGFVKGILDNVNSLMDGIKNVKMPQLAIGLTISAPVIKRFILTLVNSIKNSAKQWQALGSNISSLIGKGTGQHPIKLVTKLANEKETYETVEKEKIKIEQQIAAHPIKIATAADEGSIEKLKSKLTELSGKLGESSLTAEQWAQELKGCGIATQDLIPMLEKLANGEQITTQDIQESIKALQTQQSSLEGINTKLQNLTNSMQTTQAQLNGIRSGFATTGSAVTIFATSIFSGVGAIQSFSAANSMLIASLFSLAFQAIPQVVSVFTAATAEAAAAAKAALISTGIGAAIVAAGLLIGLIGKAIASAQEAKKEMQAEYQLAKQTEKINELKSKASEQKSELESRKEELKTTEKLFERFKELSDMQIKTTEEQEEYASLVEDIKDNFPSLVESYDNITGQLTLQEEKTSKILEMQKQQVIEQAKLKGAADYALAAANIRKTELEYSVNASQYNLIADATSSKNNTNYIAERLRSFNPGKEDSEVAVNKALSVYGIHTEEFLTAAGKNTNLSRDDWDQLAEALSDPSNEIYKTINEATERIIQLQQDERDVTIKYYEDLEKESLKEQLRTSHENLDEFSIDQIADYAQNSAKIPKELDETLKTMRENQGKVNSPFGGDNLEEWSGLDSKVQAVWTRVAQQYGETNVVEWYNSIRKDDKKYGSYINDFETQMKQYAQSEFGEDIAKALEENPELKKATETLGQQISEGTLSSNDFQKAKTDYLELFKGTEQEDFANTIVDSYEKQLSNRQEELAGFLSDTDTDSSRAKAKEQLESWSQDEMQKYQKFIDNTMSRFGESERGKAEEYIKKIKEKIGEDLSTEDIISIQEQIDFSQANAYNFDEFKQKSIDTIKEIRKVNEKEAEEMFNDLYELAKDSKVYDGSVEIGTVEDLKKEINSREEALTKHKDIVEKILNTDKPIKLTQNEIKNLEKAVKDLGAAGVKLDLSKYLKGDTLNAEAFNDALTEGLMFSIENFDKAIRALRENGAEDGLIKSLEAAKDMAISFNTSAKETFESWDKLDRKLNDVSTTLENVDKVMDQFIQDGYVNAQSLEIISGLLEDQNDLYKYVDNNLTLNVAGLKELIHTELNDIKVKYAHGQATAYQVLKLAALEKQISNTEKEWNKQTEDLEDKHKKALEDYAKAQEEVTEKQKALNEAIAEYNKLLQGSENRQSGLDLLYNYKQAISAFSDEMSRAQEILEDSNSIDKSIDALSRYTNAAHQRLAYLQAQGDRYNSGLAARRNQLFGGATSYTNELTGETTTINFGDYISYNAATGLIALNQKLIQEAKIADEWKDYIEKQVDDYNKIAQEGLKNQDEIRKLEQEIQKRREEALKKYADFEKDIAETLKSQYQEQVDNLKSKYDAMKEADSDYLDALQKAIDKQRKLRERESKWEDLAQKQKKLSLMIRDTSGANTLEAQKLEKEIQKDREQLLDETIDSAIENMQKLAESQEELRQTEIELKEALLQNTAYWNQQAEKVIAGFETAEDYVDWFVNTATGLNEQTAAQFEITMKEARDKFNEASEEISWRIQDNMSQTGDSVVETIDVTAEEIKNITQNTSDTFVDEVANTFERTKQSFNDNLDSAIEKVRSAEQALQEAINKLDEAAQAANEAAEAIRNASNFNYNPPSRESMNFDPSLNTDAIIRSLQTEAYSILTPAEGEQIPDIEDFANSHQGYEDYARTAYINAIVDHIRKTGADVEYGNKMLKIKNFSLRNKDMTTWFDQLGFTKENVNMNSQWPTADFVKRYAQGGLVNYTGPAYVDGNPEHPEAFLSSEDTERIGNAAKLLSDIPALSRSNVSTNNMTYGDTNIEINLNIDHVSSDVDIDLMLERVKQEIVDIARPIGTNVILQQQI